MNKNTFPQQIDAAFQRLEAIQQQVGETDTSPQKLVEEALEELSITLEELRTLGEELQRQNEELVATGQALAAKHQQRVTERTAALHQERNFISAVLDTTAALVVVTDTQGRIVRFNRTCERISGYTFDEVKEKCFWDLFLLPEEVTQVRSIFEQLSAGRFPNENENHWVAKDGRRRQIAWSNTALLDAEGLVEYVIGTGIDITERKRAEKALRESEELHRITLSNMSDAVFITDDGGSFTYVCPNVDFIFGYST